MRNAKHVTRNPGHWPGDELVAERDETRVDTSTGDVLAWTADDELVADGLTAGLVTVTWRLNLWQLTMNLVGTRLQAMSS